VTYVKRDQINSVKCSTLSLVDVAKLKLGLDNNNKLCSRRYNTNIIYKEYEKDRMTVSGGGRVTRLSLSRRGL